MTHPLIPMYRRLVGSRKHAFQPWFDSYRAEVKLMEGIREKLEDGKGLKDIAAYEGTDFSEDGFEAFTGYFLNKKDNGITPLNRKILSKENLDSFQQNDEFVEKFAKLIQDPNEGTYNDFSEFWSKQGVGNNPALINRVVAACDPKVTSTIIGKEFNYTFHWLQRELKLNLTFTDHWYNDNVAVTGHITEILKQAGEIDDETDPIWISIFFRAMYDHMNSPFTLKKQIVKYGPPGTGKTYQAKELSKLRFGFWQSQFAETPKGFEKAESHIELVQFHPSYSYEDFMEGLRPQKDGTLNLHNGIFKELCIRAGHWELDVASLQDKALSAKKWEALKLSDLDQHRESLKRAYWQYLWQVGDKKQLLHELIPPYFLIIDEINRAELSRVFGELMYCLEYRGIKGAIKTQYAQLNDEKTGMYQVGEDDYRFFVPHNVYVIGTMNTVDRSVESFDFALRRRFRWEQVEPDISLLRYHLKDHKSEWERLADNLESLNEAIRSEELLGSDYQIGHAYLWELPYTDVGIDEARRRVWEDSIRPLLEEYLRGTGKTKDLMEKFQKAFGL